MRQDIQKMFKKIRNLTLTDEERASLRSEIKSYVQYHPVRNVEEVRHREQSPATGIPLEAPYKRKRLMFNVLVAIVIAVTAGGGVSYAAEGAVPGDARYPVKTQVNENVRGSLNFS
jgi:hypothetical protein